MFCRAYVPFLFFSLFTAGCYCLLLTVLYKQFYKYPVRAIERPVLNYPAYLKYHNPPVPVIRKQEANIAARDLRHPHIRLPFYEEPRRTSSKTP